jgi:hypothetical protein
MFSVALIRPTPKKAARHALRECQSSGRAAVCADCLVWVFTAVLKRLSKIVVTFAPYFKLCRKVLAVRCQVSKWDKLEASRRIGGFDVIVPADLDTFASGGRLGRRVWRSYHVAACGCSDRGARILAFSKGEALGQASR